MKEGKKGLYAERKEGNYDLPTTAYVVAASGIHITSNDRRKKGKSLDNLVQHLSA